MQTQNWFETLQEDRTKGIADTQLDMVEDKIQEEQQGEHDKENQGTCKNITPKENPGTMKTNPEPLIQSQPEETKKDSKTMEVVSEDMEIGDLNLDRMEAACSDKDPALIPPQ